MSEPPMHLDGQAEGDAFTGGKRVIDTGGGHYFAGPVHIGGDFVAGDKIVAAPLTGVRALYQLPALPADFTGREAERAELAAAVRAGTAVIGLRGLGGVGKTALAAALAHELMADYPDAQIVVDLQGTTTPLAATDAAAAVVRAFEPVAQLPEDGAGLLAAYRSVLHGRRAMVLLDNAGSREQVAPLLPPPGCLLLVTSRARFALPGLKALNLDNLPLEDATALLLKIAPRIGGTARELADRCGRLPLALRLAGSALAEREELEPAEYAARLRDETRRLAELDEVAASLALSYDLLGTELQTLWRRLAVFVGDFDAFAAGEVWELETEAATEQLGALLRYSLAAYETGGKRWRLHDLARDFARSKLGADEAEAAAGLHAAHYMLALAAANDLYLDGGGLAQRGLGLFDQERANIAAGQAWAAGRWEQDAKTGRLAQLYVDAGANVLALRLQPRERIAWLETALVAARRWGLREAEGAHLNNLGNAYMALGESQTAMGYFEEALTVARQAADRLGEANALGSLGRAYTRLGDMRQAIGYHEQQVAMARALGDRRAEGIGLGHLGQAHEGLGDVRRAIDFYEQRLAVALELGDRAGEANGLGSLGNAYRNLGQPQPAIEYYQQQLTIARELGDRRGEATGLGNLGIAYADLGDARQALEYHQQALALAREIGDRATECQNLGSAANAYNDLGDTRRAIELYEQQLALAREIDNRREGARASWNLGLVYEKEGDLQKAVSLMQVMVDYERELGQPEADADAARVEAMRARLSGGE